MTRVSSSVSVWSIVPRFSMTSCIMSPMYSFGHMTKTFTIGSRISSMSCALRQEGGIVHDDLVAVRLA